MIKLRLRAQKLAHNISVRQSKIDVQISASLQVRHSAHDLISPLALVGLANSVLDSAIVVHRRQ